VIKCLCVFVQEEINRSVECATAAWLTEIEDLPTEGQGRSKIRLELSDEKGTKEEKDTT